MTLAAHRNDVQGMSVCPKMVTLNSKQFFFLIYNGFVCLWD